MDLEIEKLLFELGFRGAEAQAAARQALEAAGLTRAGKKRIAAEKRERAEAALAERFVLACARESCRAAAAATGREVLVVERESCMNCRGSGNEEALERAVAALAEAGLRKVVVVGGSPNSHLEIREQVEQRLELRLVEGVARRTGKEARHDLAWADLIVIWGGTQLDHKVSKLYTDARSPKVVTASKRSVKELAETIIEAVRRRGVTGGGEGG